MTLMIYESFKINTNTTTSTGTIGTLKPEKEPTEAYRILLVITEAPEGTTHEEALRRAGHLLQPGQEISAEQEWPDGVRRQVDSDPNLHRSWADL